MTIRNTASQTPATLSQRHCLLDCLTSHKKSISISDLPATFHDAVLAVRALRKCYLWIDSLCTLQGSRGDFKEEAKKMETVFSSAYCVLAASCASSQRDGFLHTQPGREAQWARRDREVVTIQSPDRAAAIYSCEMIDNFDQHVLEGGLNRRAWVLQERALARRTVYFTERQTYWECGHGQARLFPGDPTFPSRALAGNRGYQVLYTSYSRLGLSYDEDCPLAIRGLESRLVAAMQKSTAAPSRARTGY
ncbi:heterokaryon incompatibility protein-domain-containing protein [Staphylotrichum tortipilum]|uniref:Heterokaryon incompatibility protein-domain-containing protein n=1 Tax=Staphylotrichum tortipilum TaxID=2831512 RepID=A0AAN6MDY2_9PEZI|nr:heterokaryon incompatibility protein-domain-containing protein [Staphylotrichum longicolle]